MGGLGMEKTRAERNPNLGRVELRRAASIDPGNAEVALKLSNMLLQSENDRALRGRDAEVSFDALRESMMFLDRATATGVAPALAARQKGETAEFLSQLELRRGNRDAAKTLNAQAADAFARAIRLSPSVREGTADIYARAMVASWRDGRMAMASVCAREALRRGGRELIDAREAGPAIVAAESALGNFPGAMLELRHQVRLKPGDPRRISALERAALDLRSQATAVLALEGLEREGRLSPEGARLLSQLRASTAGTPPRTPHG